MHGIVTWNQVVEVWSKYVMLIACLISLNAALPAPIHDSRFSAIFFLLDNCPRNRRALNDADSIRGIGKKKERSALFSMVFALKKQLPICSDLGSPVEAFRAIR